MSITVLDEQANPLVAGDDYDVDRRILGIPEGDALAAADLIVKESEFDADADAIITKHVTTVPVNGQGEIYEDSAGDVHVLFQLTAAETAALDPYFQYAYAIVVETVEAKRYTRETGYVTARVPIRDNA